MPRSTLFILLPFAIQNFGSQNYAPIAFVGSHQCTSTTWQSDSSLVCVVPAGVGTAVAVKVTVAGQTGSRLAAFSYNSEPSPVSQRSFVVPFLPQALC